MSAPSSIGRRSVLKSGAAVVAGSALHPTWACASITPAIPQATVRFGGFAVTNHAWTMLASKKGFLADVGITMAGGVPKSLLETQVIPQLQNGELDMTTYWFGLAIQALDKVPNVHPVLVYSFFQGSTLLGRPDKGYKTVDEFMAGGMAGRKPQPPLSHRSRAQSSPSPPARAPIRGIILRCRWAVSA